MYSGIDVVIFENDQIFRSDTHTFHTMEYTDGPDQIIPAANFTTTAENGSVKLRSTGHEFEDKHKPMSVPGLLHKTATTYPDSIALISALSEDKQQVKYTYAEYEAIVRTVAKAFIKLGLERFRSVCILGFNCPQWFFANLGAIYAGGLAVGTYTTNSSEACHFVASNSKSNIIVVEDDVQLQKILAIRDRLPVLKAIVQYTGKPTHEDVLSWDDLMELGQEQSDAQLDEILKTIAVNQCCTIIYTSGTVGNPKGVMLSHDNLTFDTQAVMEHLEMVMQQELIISYLPLSHIAAQIVDIYLMMSLASTTYFADKGALKGSLLKTLEAARPTRFLAVPRVWEKIQEKMVQVGSQNGFVKKQIAAWARAQGLQYNLNRINGIYNETWGFMLANALVFKKIKQTLGFDRCTTFATAAAPLSPAVKQFFLSINIPIIEAYGMSEASGAHSLGSPKHFHLESVGQALPGVQTKICNPGVDSGEGEICFYGRHVSMGYIDDPEKTKDAIDEEGWLHSGDLGRVDESGLTFITGRSKELLITAGGENIAPVPIEQLFKTELPHVSNAVLIGDNRKFLSILLTLKTEVDQETMMPRDSFTKEVEDWLKKLGSNASSTTELLEEGPIPEVLAAIQTAIDKVNEKAISNAQKIQKFAILPNDFSIASGEIGPTMKLKRHIIVEKHVKIIDELYFNAN